MSWIRSADGIATPEAPSRSDPGADMTALFRALALDPAGAQSIAEHARTLAGEPTPLPLAQAELIGVVVSATNGCGYCVAHYGPRLARALGDEPLARAVARDYREANLAARDRVLLDYAVALTCEPSERKEDDVERIREYGFDDAAILRATHLAAYVGLLNRLASGLGVALEPNVQAWEFGDQR